MLRYVILFRFLFPFQIENMNEDCDGGKYPVKVEISELGEEKKLYSCSICNDGFDTKTATRNHLWDRHEIDSLDGNTNNTTIANTDLIKEIHEFQFCDKTYPSKTQLFRHLRLKHSVKTYKKHQVPNIKVFPSIKNLKSSNVTIKVEPSLDNVTDEDFEDENTKTTSITNTDPFRDTFTVNPWQVESIEAFAYLKCPECVFDCKEAVIFQEHAVENHPLSNVLFDVECNFFEKIEVKQELSDISVVKQEVPEMLHSVEEHESIGTKFSKNRSNQTFSLRQKPVYDKNDSFSCHICQISFHQKKHYKAHITHLNQDATRSLKCCACDKKISFGNGIRTPIRHIESVHLGNSKTHLKLKHAIEEDKKLEVSRVKIFPSIKNIKASNITIIGNPSIDNITEEVHNAIDIEKITNKENGIIKEEISVNGDPKNTLVENVDYDSENSNTESVHEGTKKFVCSFCNHSYHRKSNLREHVEIVHEGKKRRSLTFKCHFCAVRFIQLKDLKQHIGTEHEGKKPHNCSLCNSGFILKAQLTRHFKAVHEKNRPHKCSVCHKGFSEARGLSHHIAHVHEGKKLYSCPICDDGFDTKMAMKKHLWDAHEIDGETVHEVIPSIAQKPVYDRRDPNSCHICLITFHQQQYYRSHITTVQDGKKSLRCCACNSKFSFTNTKYLTKHIAKVHESKSFAEKKELEKHEASVYEGQKHSFNCTICNAYFPLKITLNKHMEEVHDIFIGRKTVKKIRKTVKEIIKKFNCTICHADFSLKSTLNTHMEAVHEVKKPLSQKPVKERLKCNQCDKTYSSKMSLEYHVEVVHLQLKKFQCDQCPLNFASKNGFEYHVASKHENKKHPCTKCDRIFMTINALKDHVLRHHEKRLDFKCEYCGKEFPSLAEVNRHVRLIHHGIKVKCDLCDKEMSNSLRLWKHKVFHHNETKDAWICEKCPRKRWSAFQTQAIYDKHMKEVHEGIKPNKCNICSRMFSTMKTLNLHISKIHEASEENQYHMAKKKST